MASRPLTAIFWLLAGLIVATAIVLRAYGLTGEPLWLDEAYSAYAAGKGWAFLWCVVPQYETHPPFYYSLLRLWTLVAGDDLAALRALGLACGAATLLPAALATREAGRSIGWQGARVAGAILAALALIALSPILIEMTREVRPYPVMILTYAAALLALLRLRARTAARQPIAGRAYAAYLFGLALMLWLHNLGALYAAALGLALLALVVRLSLSRTDWAWLIGGHLLVLAIWAPALAILADQAPTWVRSTWLTFTLDSMLAWRVSTLYGLPSRPEIAAGALLALAASIALARSGEGRRVAAALLLTAGLPVILSVLLSTLVTPVFITRTLAPVAVPALILIGFGAMALPARWRLGTIALLGFVLVQTARHDVAIRAAARPMQDWYPAVRWLGERFRPGDIVFAYPNEGALPFDRAARDLGLALPSVQVPTPVPSIGVGGWHPTGSRGVVSLPRARLAAIARGTGRYPTVWLLRLGPWAYDKGDIFLEELSRGRIEVARYRDGPIDIVGLKVAPVTLNRLP